MIANFLSICFFSCLSSVDEAVFSGSGDKKKARIPKYKLAMAAPVSVSTGGKCMSHKLSKDESESSGKSGTDESRPPAAATDADVNEWEKDAIVQLQMKALREYLKEGKVANFDKMSRLLENSSGENADFLCLKLQRLDLETKFSEEVPEDQIARLGDIVSVADALLSKLDVPEIAAFFGVHRVHSVEAEKSDERKAFESKKATLISCLFRRARALFCIQGFKSMGEEDEREKSFNELQRWHEMDGKTAISSELGEKLGEKGASGAVGAVDFALLSIHRHLVRDCPALALKAADTFLSSSHVDGAAPRSIADLRLTIMRKLDWTHIAEAEKGSIALRYPKGLESM